MNLSYFLFYVIFRFDRFDVMSIRTGYRDVQLRPYTRNSCFRSDRGFCLCILDLPFRTRFGKDRLKFSCFVFGSRYAGAYGRRTFGSRWIRPG